MPQTLLELAFSVGSLNDPAAPVNVQKFGSTRYDEYAQGLFAKGRDHSADEKMAQAKMARWRETTISRAPAPFGAGSRAPGVALEHVDGQVKTATMAEILVESQPIPLDQLTSPEAAQNALADVALQNRKRIAISKEILAWQTLKGAVAINPNTVPGSQLSFSYNFGVTTLTVGADWSDKTTPIASTEQDRLAGLYHDACGLQARKAVIDRKVKGYIKQNNDVRSFIQNDPDPVRRMLMTEKIMGSAFGGFQFDEMQWDVHATKYSLNGTLTKYLGNNQMIVLPADEDLPLVLGRAEGYGTIPREAFGSESVAGMGYRAPQKGLFAYAYTIPKPASVVVVWGWCGLFVLTFPEAVGVNADVTVPGAAYEA